MTWRTLDMAAYKRQAHFDYFRSLPWPWVGTTVEVEVTDLLGACRRQGYSFFLSFLHAAALAADSVPQLRQRIRGDGIVEYDQCPTSHTELLADETYCYCTLRHHMPFLRYLAQAEEARQACRKNGIEEEDAVEGMYFVSSLPWLSYTALIQPVGGGDESNPRISWGKYREGADGRALMPVSVLAHHALVDEIHLARFYENLTREIRRTAEEARGSGTPKGARSG